MLYPETDRERTFGLSAKQIRARLNIVHNTFHAALNEAVNTDTGFDSHLTLDAGIRRRHIGIAANHSHR